ncbi:MAG: DUF362 domain-containing protein [Terriglobales bacterium]
MAQYACYIPAMPNCVSTRREFLRACAAGAAVAATSGLHAFAQAAVKSRVVSARDPALRGSSGTPDAARVLNLLDRAVQALYDTDDSLQAWKRIVRPGETVGLKVNCLAGRGASTNVVLIEAICERLQQAGIREENIVIWDRLESDLESAGLRARRRLRVIGNDSAGYEDELSIHGSVASRLSQTLTRTCDAVINLPVLKDHGISGVTLALKSFFGAVHNPNKYHPDGCNPYIADLNMLEPIRRKVRLHICDAITAQYEGGPSFMPQWQWPYNGLLVGRDPVALDYTGWQIIDRQRAEKGLKSLAAAGRAPAYIATAADARHRLGANDPRLIERMEV